MAQLAKSPAALWIVGLVSVVQLVLLFIAGYLDLPLLPVALAAVLALTLLLLLGSRIAWTLWMAAVILDVVARFGGEQPTWMLGLDAVILVALLLPSSLRFVWTDRQESRFSTMDRLPRFSYGVIAWRLGFALIALFWLSGMAEAWRNDNRGSSALAALAEVTNIALSISLLAFVVSLGAWLYGSFRAGSRRGLDEESRSALGE